MWKSLMNTQNSNELGSEILEASLKFGLMTITGIYQIFGNYDPQYYAFLILFIYNEVMTAVHNQN